MIERWYLACMILVTSPFFWYHVVTLTITFYLLQGQICCQAGPQFFEFLKQYFTFSKGTYSFQAFPYMYDIIPTTVAVQSDSAVRHYIGPPEFWFRRVELV